MIVLFGGGDGGGFIITANGIRKIPPYDPPILHALKAARHLAEAGARKGTAGDLAGIATRVASGAFEQIQKSAGSSFDRGGEIVFLDADGGFVCGSVGKPPIPIPFPRGLELQGSLAEHAEASAEMAEA
jgi:hypothetical protein